MPWHLWCNDRGYHSSGKTGKTRNLMNKNSLQGKIREYEFFWNIREKSGNLKKITNIFVQMSLINTLKNIQCTYHVYNWLLVVSYQDHIIYTFISKKLQFFGGIYWFCVWCRVRVISTIIVFYLTINRGKSGNFIFQFLW